MIVGLVSFSLILFSFIAMYVGDHVIWFSTNVDVYCDTKKNNWRIEGYCDYAVSQYMYDLSIQIALQNNQSVKKHVFLGSSRIEFLFVPISSCELSLTITPEKAEPACFQLFINEHNEIISSAKLS